MDYKENYLGTRQGETKTIIWEGVGESAARGSYYLTDPGNSSHELDENVPRVVKETNNNLLWMKMY